MDLEKMTMENKKTILIADDDPVMLRLLQLNLQKAGFRVVSCPEGTTVFETALAEQPVMALLDYLLPGRTGLELIKDFKGHDALRVVPIIIVTGQGKGSTRNELMEAGAVAVFTKPFSPSLLIATIEQHLAIPKDGVGVAPVLSHQG